MLALACLPAEVSIVTSTLVLAALAIGEEHLQNCGVLVRDCPHSPSIVVAEGVLLLPQKTVDKIRK